MRLKSLSVDRFSMDDSTPRSPRPPSPARLSRTPSWVLLGFLLGAGSVWVFGLARSRGLDHPKELAQNGEQARSSSPVKTAEAKAAVSGGIPATKAQPKLRHLSDIEAVFEEWGRYAIWDQNRTEVALWNSERNAYADAYEVFRDPEGHLFFRSIPRLTRPLLAHATKAEAPLVFTESLAMHQEWLESRGQLAPATPVPVPEPPAELSTTPKPTAPVQVEAANPPVP